MVAIAPFRALRFDEARVDLAKATSPPHDCITTAQRDGFLAADAHNIVRVVLPPDQPGDVEAPAKPNKFQRADAALRQWVADATMLRDGKPAFYRYTIEHGPPGARLTMQGVLARVRLDPTYHEVRRHEKTLQRKKRERLRLREATGVDTEPIWLLYRDERGWVDEILSSNAIEELLRFTDEEGHEHRLWRVDRPEAVGEVTAQFDDRHLVIADGHHRYQTALDHFAATKRAEDGSILACLVRDNDPGTRIEATHRLVTGLSMTVEKALEAIGKHWEAALVPLPAGPDAAVLTALRASLGRTGTRDPTVLHLDRGRLLAHRLRLKPGSALDGSRGRLDTLAVTLVHDRLLRDCWGLDPEKPEENLRFTRNLEEAVQAVRSGACQLAVLPPPEPVHAVLEVAEQGHVMPQKATYFVPKLRSGLVLGPLDEPLPKTWQEQAGDGGKPETKLPRL
ncbi:MAG: hypothetical protein QOC71_698 [Thermoplasmata archaeon]|nr:hypothetical protein [Thermoplasmata archaeon]